MKEIVIKLSDTEYNQLIYGDDGLDYEILEQATVNGTVLPEHGELIDKTELYMQTTNWEAQALEQVEKYNPIDSRDEWRWWSAVLKERTAFRCDLEKVPTILEADTESEE